jgi:hypothetical protein
MYLIGSPARDYDTVLAEFNKKDKGLFPQDTPLPLGKWPH